MQRRFVVGKRDQRLDAVFCQFIEQVIVELQASFVRFGFVAVREDARPSDGCTVCFEAHFSEQGDIFFVTVVEVDPFQFHVVRCRSVGDRSESALRGYVLNGKPLSVNIISTFVLVCGCCATP
ncbi:hypothetical protein SDC9_166032 [bioreactor metagenome]|uniref:Uncharacterized protein n=1 Tax=bioreactor metagenome TaxID=1076179 RepID=A0A645FYF7_9ZZZZ